jgi:hypothetical protein
MTVDVCPKILAMRPSDNSNFGAHDFDQEKRVLPGFD